MKVQFINDVVWRIKIELVQKIDCCRLSANEQTHHNIGVQHVVAIFNLRYV